MAEEKNMRGGSGDDRMSGGSGDDRMSGGRGDDNMRGGSGDDRMSGGSGDDIMSGGRGNDELRGGRGDDTLKGGSGDDTLTGGEGSDTFVHDFAPGNGDGGNTVIQDFNPDVDTLSLEDFGEDFSISMSDDGHTIIAGNQSSVTIHNVSPDQLGAENTIINGVQITDGNLASGFSTESSGWGDGADDTDLSSIVTADVSNGEAPEVNNPFEDNMGADGGINVSSEANAPSTASSPELDAAVQAIDDVAAAAIESVGSDVGVTDPDGLDPSVIDQAQTSPDENSSEV